MNAVSEVMINDGLDDIAPVARHSEEYAVLQKKDPVSILQTSHKNTSTLI